LADPDCVFPGREHGGERSEEVLPLRIRWGERYRNLLRFWTAIRRWIGFNPHFRGGGCRLTGGIGWVDCRLEFGLFRLGQARPHSRFFFFCEQAAVFEPRELNPQVLELLIERLNSAAGKLLRVVGRVAFDPNRA